MQIFRILNFIISLYALCTYKEFSMRMHRNKTLKTIISVLKSLYNVMKRNCII